MASPSTGHTTAAAPAASASAVAPTSGGRPSLLRFYKRIENVRNLCIVAHVDHGKTTLADSLLASNGVISSRMAGQLRYLDSREDEQRRGITMKASVVTLLHRQGPETYLVNLIDSPGHVDFSSEVSSAARLSDGAVVVVDVVEGVSAQTHAVLRQAWRERLRPCLVLNKIDRLITELCLEPHEAYRALQRTLEQVNAITGALFTSDAMARRDAAADPHQGEEVEGATARAGKEGAGPEGGDNGDSSGSGTSNSAEEEPLYFEPERGNVVFSSAVDGWGFSVADFARFLSGKLGCRAATLQKCLWGDHYLTKEKGKMQVRPGAEAKGKVPLFARLVLQNIWDVYAAVGARDRPRLDKICSSLGIKVLAPRVLQSQADRPVLQALFAQWLPLARAVMDMAVAVLPSPQAMSHMRVQQLFYGARAPSAFSAATRALLPDVESCAPAPAETLAFVAKMVALDRDQLPEHQRQRNRNEQLTEAQAAEKRAAIIARRRREAAGRESENAAGAEGGFSSSTGTGVDEGVPLTAEAVEALEAAEVERAAKARVEHEAQKAAAAATATKENEKGGKEEEEEGPLVMVAYTRVLSGTLRREQDILVLGAKYDPAEPTRHCTSAKVKGLYLLMGRELVAVDEAPAGSVVGVTGLGAHVLKTATLSTTPACPSLSALTATAAPIVRVALDTERIADMPALAAGMRLLGQADPCVQVLLQETGEHVLVAAGEVHVERCLTDLRERFAPGIKVRASKPIVPFRETVIPEAEVGGSESVLDHGGGGCDEEKAEKRGDNSGDEEDRGEGENKEQQGPHDTRLPPPRHYLLEGIDVGANGVASVKTQPNRRWTISIRAEALPPAVTALLTAHEDTLRTLHTDVAANREAIERRRRIASDVAAPTLYGEEAEDMDAIVEVEMGPEIAVEIVKGVAGRGTGGNSNGGDPRAPKVAVVAGDAAGILTAPELYIKLRDAFDAAGPQWAGTADRVWALGPRNVGANLLVQHVPGFPIQGFFAEAAAAVASEEGDGPETVAKAAEQQQQPATAPKSLPDVDATVIRELRRFVSSVQVGFQIVTQAGPLCEEPLQGVCFHLEAVDIAPADRAGAPDPQFSGSVISAAREACRQAFLAQPARLVSAMYACDLVMSSASLGRVYDVLARRRGRVLSEEMKEGTDSFLIRAVLPVAQSFGFASELRKRTGGLAVPQLIFSHWETIQEDPFWVPTTEEELTHYGEIGDAPNAAREQMDAVRRRKGLRVEEKLVEHGAKQRTRARKKG
eukprot:UC1_evm1s2177